MILDEIKKIKYKIYLWLCDLELNIKHNQIWYITDLNPRIDNEYTYEYVLNKLKHKLIFTKDCC